MSITRTPRHITQNGMNIQERAAVARNLRDGHIEATFPVTYEAAWEFLRNKGWGAVRINTRKSWEESTGQKRYGYTPYSPYQWYIYRIEDWQQIWISRRRTVTEVVRDIIMADSKNRRFFKQTHVIPSHVQKVLIDKGLTPYYRTNED